MIENVKVVPKGRKREPKKYILTQYWECETGRMSRAIGDVVYTDIDKASGEILKSFMESRAIMQNIEIGDEIESTNCIEIPVFTPDRYGMLYEFSYFITKVY